jgi:hypothetical protein
MSTTLQTRSGTCPTHGRVQAERQLPRISFPFVVTAVLRFFALRRPFRCPECGAVVG